MACYVFLPGLQHAYPRAARPALTWICIFFCMMATKLTCIITTVNKAKLRKSIFGTCCGIRKTQ